jgi:hypothetical protein
MRFLWAYLLVGIVFGFGFLCASAFSVGRTRPRYLRRE